MIYNNLIFFTPSEFRGVHCGYWVKIGALRFRAPGVILAFFRRMEEYAVFSRAGNTKLTSWMFICACYSKLAVWKVSVTEKKQTKEF